MSRLIRKFIALLSIGMIIATAILLKSDNLTLAVSGSDWNAGNIISDSQFFKSDSMSTDEIQNFLNSMVPNCDTLGTQAYGSGTRAQQGTSTGHPPPYTCLKNYLENPITHQNNANGGTVDGGWSAAQIIKYASDTYSISPKVLLVLIQKEQSLVTDTWPYTNQYRSATGYGCPDTAPCDAEYYGFYNQVMNASFQFQLYARKPSNYRYKAYQTNFIQWSPVSGCGGSDVYITNQATAGLYNYTPYQPNSAALGNLYNSGDSCSAYGNRNFWRLYNDWFGSTQTSEIFLSYKSHVSILGWLDTINNSGTTGTTGQSIAMEAIKIDGAVEYSTYNNTTGWQPTVSSGMISGTTGMGRPIQAIKINPTSTLSDRYDIYYRTHISNIGWLGWTKNGQIAGVTGDDNKNIEAVEIRLVAKGFGISGSIDNSYIDSGTTSYLPNISLGITAHVGYVGWQPTVTDTMVSGTTEQSKRIEAIKISLTNNTGFQGDITYAGYLADIGWQNFVSDNEISGTTGQSRRMEAIRIALTGAISDNYDISYRGYVQYMGWLGWVKNGDTAGSMGASRQLEAIETRIVAKGASTSTTGLYNPQNIPVPESYSLIYSTHLSNIGWVSNINQNAVGGTTGQTRPLEALRFDSLSSVVGEINISCSAYVQDSGWVNDITTGNTCGTTGLSKPMEAVRLKLNGAAAGKYDLYYKVHSSYIGWQDWVKNDEQAGVILLNEPIEAIVIKLVQK